VRGAADVEANWDVIKQTERPSRSVADGVPLALPALALAAKLQSRGARAGAWTPPSDPGGELQRAAQGAAAEPTERSVAECCWPP